MLQIKCPDRVSVDVIVRNVVKTGEPVVLVDAMDKSIAGGLVKVSSVRMRWIGNNLLIKLR